VKSPPFPCIAAVGDGATDDTAALKSIANYVNNSPEGSRFAVTFPKGTYNISDTIWFKRPVTLLATLYVASINWVGLSNIIFKLGDDNINADNNVNVNYRKNKDYNVIGLKFIGGNEYLQYGIFFNELVTQPRVSNCWFENFNADWCIYAARHVWDLVIQGCKHDIEFDSDGVGNTLQTGFFKMYPYGNSRIRILDNLISCHDFRGTMIYMNGASCQILRNKIEACYRAIVVGDECRDTYIAYNYFESATLVDGDKKGIISIGSFAGDEVTTNKPNGVFIFNNYVDLHRSLTRKTSYFVAPTKETDLLKKIKLRDNYINAWVSDYTPTTVVYQNEIGGQYENEANGNVILGVISAISNWQSGNEAWSGNNSNTDFPMPFNPDNGIFRDIRYNGDNYKTSGHRLIKNGAAVYQDLVDPSDYILKYCKSGLYERVYPSGKIEYGIPTVNQEYDFNGFVAANYLKLKSARASGTVPNGSFFENVDNSPYYKNQNGIIYRLARLVATPETSGAAGLPGDYSYDTNFMYICVSTNNWKRIALSTW
jgi:hypothetical protein